MVVGSFAVANDADVGVDARQGLEKSLRLSAAPASLWLGQPGGRRSAWRVEPACLSRGSSTCCGSAGLGGESISGNLRKQTATN